MIVHRSKWIEIFCHHFQLLFYGFVNLLYIQTVCMPLLITYNIIDEIPLSLYLPFSSLACWSISEHEFIFHHNNHTSNHHILMRWMKLDCLHICIDWRTMCGQWPYICVIVQVVFNCPEFKFKLSKWYVRVTLDCVFIAFATTFGKNELFKTFTKDAKSN